MLLEITAFVVCYHRHRKLMQDDLENFILSIRVSVILFKRRILKSEQADLMDGELSE